MPRPSFPLPAVVWIPLLLLLACGGPDRVPAANSVDPEARVSAPTDARVTTTDRVSVGAPAPAYAVSTLAGDSLIIGPSPSVTLVNVWATWCVSCKEEFALMDELLAQYGSLGLRIVAVSVDAGSVAPVQRVARQYGVTFEVAHDPEGRIEAAYPAIGVPASYLIGRDGRLLWKRVGVLTPEVADTIARALHPSVSSPPASSN